MNSPQENSPTGEPISRRRVLQILGASALTGGAALAGINCKPEGPSSTRPIVQATETAKPTAVDQETEETKGATSRALGDNEDQEGAEDNPSNPQPIEVEAKDFQRLVDYIEKYGLAVKERGVPCDHQYTFFDRSGNRHDMITIKRDENDRPSMEGKVDQISVWAYRQGIRDDEHYFGYIITDTGIRPHTPEERNDVEFGYREFLDKVKK